MRSHSIRSSANAELRQRISSRPLVRTIGTWVSFGLLATLMIPFSQGQQPAPARQPHSFPNVKMTQAPLSHIYMNFLLLQNLLDREATAREMQGRDGSTLRDHFQKQLGFSGSEFAIVRATGLRLQPELKQINDRVKVIVQGDRAARLQAPNRSSLLASPNPMLQDLVKEREDTIQREVTQMNRDLGPTAAAKLQTYLESHLQSRTSIHLRAVPHAQKQLSVPVPRQPGQP